MDADTIGEMMVSGSSSGKTAADRRKFIRIANDSVLKSEPLTAAGLFGQDLQKTMEGLVKNVSAGGVLFETNKKYAIGDVLKLDLDLSGWEKFKTEFYKEERTSQTRPLTVLAHVVRVDVLSVDKLYDVGACISAIDEGHRSALTKFIEDRIKKGQARLC